MKARSVKKIRRKPQQQRRSSTTRVIAARARIGGRSPQKGAPTPATNDNAATDREYDQYYTVEEVAAHLYGLVPRNVDLTNHLLVEPSAGTGSFFRLMPPGSRGYDVDPKYPGIITADFLTVTVGGDRPIAFIGNPPFGKNASLAVRFFNHAAREASVIGFIVPRSFRKASVENRLDRSFHLVHEEPVPANAFLFRGKPYSVPAVFQIRERRAEPRPLRRRETTHPDFTFLKTAEGADFAIHRVGAKAGKVHHNMTASPNSNYFIKGNKDGVEAIMRQLDFDSAVGNVAGNPSLAKSEIVTLYRAFVRRRGRRHSGRRGGK